MSTTRHSETCPHCGSYFTYERHHAGFSNQGFMYCSDDETILLWDTYNPIYQKLTDKHPWMLSVDEQRKVEEAIKPCPYGGNFAFANPPLCPSCHESVAFIVPDPIYYVVTGRKLDGDTESVWHEVVN